MVNKYFILFLSFEHLPIKINLTELRYNQWNLVRHYLTFSLLEYISEV